MAAVDLSKLVKEKRLWAASFLIAWAAALQGHMMWLKRQDAFKDKFGDPEAPNKVTEQPVDDRASLAGEQGELIADAEINAFKHKFSDHDGPSEVTEHGQPLTGKQENLTADVEFGTSDR